MVPISAFVAVTSRCSSDCTYCSIKERRCGDELSREQWLEVIDQLHALRTCLIAFTGGEPLARDDLPELVRAARDGGAEVELFTSGMGLTAGKARALREAGLWAMGVSLDRSDPEAVNRIRRHTHAFEAAIGAIEMSRRTGFYTFINAVADREMVVSGEYRRLYEFASRLGVHELRLIEPMPCGRLMSDPRGRLLEPAHIADLRRFHRQTNRRGQGPKICAFNEMESPELFGCVAGTQHLFIDPSGEVCPCDFTPLSFGNVLNERLDAVWQRMSSAMILPRRQCFMKTHGDLVRRQAATDGLPLPVEASCRIAGGTPPGPLPDYFQMVTRPFGFPHAGHAVSEAHQKHN